MARCANWASAQVPQAFTVQAERDSSSTRSFGVRMWKRIADLFRGSAHAAPTSLAEDILQAAERTSTALIMAGYHANFTLGSLAEVDRLFADHSNDGEAIAGGYFSESLGSRLFGIGSYSGEVLRRSIGGEWVTDDSDPQGEINVTLELANGSTCWPMQRAMKRFQSAENNIAHWAALLQKG